MSTTGGWIPVQPEKMKPISDHLKRILANKYELDDYGQAVLSKEDIGYLEGLGDGGVRDVAGMIAAIKKYGAIKFIIVG